MTVKKPNEEKLMKKYDLDINKLDYKYIGKCCNTKELEQIYHVLSSGEEGIYPQLIQYAEDKLSSLKPESKFLRRDIPITKLGRLDQQTRREIFEDIDQWRHEMCELDSGLLKTENKDYSEEGAPLPPIRGSICSTAVANLDQMQLGTKTDSQSHRIKSWDYRSWDKYDVEAELDKLEWAEEEMSERLQEKLEKDIVLETNVCTDNLSEIEKEVMAAREKDKGNEYFRSGDYRRAAVYYTRSINIKPSLAAYNNRAQTNIKLGKFGAVLYDCNNVLRQDTRNVKALMRRGIARKHSQDWLSARNDFQTVLSLEPDNRYVQQHLYDVESNILSGKKAMKKITIQEIDSSKDVSINCGRVKEENTDQLTRGSLSDGDRVDATHLINYPTNLTDRAVRSEHFQDRTTDIESSHRVSPREDPEFSSPSIRGDINRLEREESSNCQCDEKGSEGYCGPSSCSTSAIHSQNNDTNNRRESNRKLLDSSGTAALSAELHTDSHTIPEKPAAQNWTSFNFMKRWREISTGRSTASKIDNHAELLENVDPLQLTGLLGPHLDAGVLKSIIHCVEVVIVRSGKVDRCFKILKAIAASERFCIVKMMLDDQDRARLNKISTELQRNKIDISELEEKFRQ